MRREDDLNRYPELLEAANRDLEAFTYSVSHDLRAPLRAIDGFSRILLEDHSHEFSAEARYLLERIRNATGTMSTQIDSILLFSRVDRREMQKTAVAMDSVAQGVVRELTHMNGDKKIEFRIGALPAAYADRPMVKHVFFNLLSNSVKFSSVRKEPYVEVTGLEDNGELIYSIKDNGVGFDTRYSDKLFKVFQRLHKQSEFEGSGVGLAIVKKIITRHQGRVWAESELGRGATFSFSLPIA